VEKVRSRTVITSVLFLWWAEWRELRGVWNSDCIINRHRLLTSRCPSLGCCMFSDYVPCTLACGHDLKLGRRCWLFDAWRRGWPGARKLAKLHSFSSLVRWFCIQMGSLASVQGTIL